MIFLRLASIAFFSILPNLSQGSEQTFTSPLPIGGGGWLVAGDIANDGQIIAVTDTYGAWIRPPGASKFTQFINCDSMPVANCGYFPRTGASQVLQNNGPPTAVAACPQNSAVIYMIYNGYAFKSTDHASTFRRLSGFNGGTQIVQAVNGVYRYNGRKAACDPHNINHAYVSTDSNGLFETNDGGSTWTIASVPISTGDNGSNGGAYPNYNIAFDASSRSASNCGPTSNNTCNIYVFSYVNVSGTLNGKLYASINGGTSWSATSGGPTTCGHLIVSPLDGVVWLTDQTTSSIQGIVWKFSGGTRGTFTSFAAHGSNYHSVAADPAVDGRIVAATDQGTVNIATMNGASWLGPIGFTRTAKDIPWLATTWEYSMSNGDMIFDHSKTNHLVFFEGIGVWEGSPPQFGSASFTWNSITANIEQMDAQALRPLPNGNVVVGVQDRTLFTLTPGTYPSHQKNTFLDGIALAVGSDVDFAKSDPTHLAAIMMPWGGTPSLSGSSTDSGISWKPFNSFYTTFTNNDVTIDGSNQWKISVSHSAATALTTFSGGSGSIVRVIPGGFANGGRASASWPVTVDSTGNTVTLQGSKNNGNISLGAGTYAMYVDMNPLSNGNGTYNIRNAADNGRGQIRITITSNGYVFGNNTKICISGDFGVPNAIGCWVAINVDPSANTLDLYGSRFHGKYTSGGVMIGPVRSGGMIAQSTANNIILIPSDKSYPQCTMDGGQTWRELSFPSTPALADTGWSFAHYLIRHVLVADPVEPNIFYGYNYNVGVVKFSFCETPRVVSGSQLNNRQKGYTTNTPTANLFLSSTFNSVLTAVPGKNGNLFFASGPQGNPSSGPGSVPLYRSTDGGQNWFAVPNVTNPVAVSCGATKPGATYPTCYVVGWVDVHDGKRATYGIFRSIDADQGRPGWVKVEDYPNGNMDQAYVIAADLNIWNQWYIGFGGSSFAYGRQN
jgi:hypothetical protein